MAADYQIAAYYFANYHPGDPRNALVHGEGWSEWDVVRRAVPRFQGHYQPRVPQWGYEDESDPEVMAKKIAAAAEHGLSAFIFDWYWYNDGPFLERALEKGFLGAANNRDLKFSMMWANHNWVDLHPAKAYECRMRDHRLLYPGPVTRATFDTVVTYTIETYFKHPSYWLIDGAPY
ncbi:MAG: glycoside hydrolase family 99-like domain-containing protein, partial [Anaerolineaceae bacterium]|nr:glycoside hydrolase family 99-like domain-containing protein [Anaerolineaceae bacterium]